MPRLFRRVGPWLLALAAAWYLAGNYLIQSLEQQSLGRAKSLHKMSQVFDMGKPGTVVISTSGHSFSLGKTVQIRFDPHATQATVNNDNLRVSVRGQLIDGVLQIELNSDDRSRYGPQGNLNIVLPASTRKLGVAGESSFEISGRFSDPKSSLTLDSMECNSRLELDHLTVSQLKLLSTCNARIALGKQVLLEKLEVSMGRGTLDFSAEAIPKTDLYLGESVVVTGRRVFLETARFGRPPQ